MENEYISRNTGTPCKFPHFIAEMMCYRKGDREKKNLPYKFWNLSIWKTFYKSQLVSCNALLKLYSPALIARTLRRADCQSVFSLRSPWLAKKLAEERDREILLQRMAEQKKAELTLPSQEEVGISHREVFKKKNSLEEL